MSNLPDQQKFYSMTEVCSADKAAEHIGENMGMLATIQQGAKRELEMDPNYARIPAALDPYKTFLEEFGAAYGIGDRTTSVGNVLSMMIRRFKPYHIFPMNGMIAETVTVKRVHELFRLQGGDRVAQFQMGKSPYELINGAVLNAFFFALMEKKTLTRSIWFIRLMEWQAAVCKSFLGSVADDIISGKRGRRGVQQAPSLSPLKALEAFISSLTPSPKTSPSPTSSPSSSSSSRSIVTPVSFEPVQTADKRNESIPRTQKSWFQYLHQILENQFNPPVDLSTSTPKHERIQALKRRAIRANPTRNTFLKKKLTDRLVAQFLETKRLELELKHSGSK